MTENNAIQPRQIQLQGFDVVKQSTSFSTSIKNNHVLSAMTVSNF
jgi:hypothetical protein